MSKESTSLSPDWVRCKSKSRANKYFMFNKKTGETTWCPDSAASSSQTRKTVSAKDVKTPAQDRLKRLQNNLQKKKLDESLTESGKNGRNSKKAEKSSTVGKRLEDEKDKPSCSKVQDRLKILSDKPIADVKCKQKPKVSQKRKSDSSEATNETPTKIIRSPPEGGDSVESKPTTFVIPKKAPTTSISISPKPQVGGDACNESKVLSLTDTSQQSDEPSSSTDKSQTSEESSEFDENDNKKHPKGDQRQTGFLSKLKTFYNKIVSSATSPEETNVDRERQSGLSSMSKTSFKPKRPEKKNVLRGILQENDNGKLAMTMENFSSKIRKVSSPIPVPSESANARLQRLRKSLHEQHSYSSPAESETSSISDITSDGAIEFSGSFRSPNILEPDCEPMDWQPISDCIVSSSPSASEPVTNLSTVSEHYDTVNENLMRMAAQRKQKKPWKPEHYYIVVDTNVFIDYLTFIDELSAMKLCDSRGSLIYVPYCVLQELDKLKIRSSSESVKTRAVRAIKYLNKSFNQQNPRIQAQSAADETNHLITVKSPDDSILNCCLQIKKHVKNLILLTEDVNLQNKAKCNDILVSTKSDLISRH